MLDRGHLSGHLGTRHLKIALTATLLKRDTQRVIKLLRLHIRNRIHPREQRLKARRLTARPTNNRHGRQRERRIRLIRLAALDRNDVLAIERAHRVYCRPRLLNHVRGRQRKRKHQQNHRRHARQPLDARAIPLPAVTALPPLPTHRGPQIALVAAQRPSFRALRVRDFRHASAHTEKTTQPTFMHAECRNQTGSVPEAKRPHAPPPGQVP